MELPKKPTLEYETYIESNGVLVQQLTAESEQRWSRYLHADRLARAAIWRAQHEEQQEEVSNP